MMVNNKINSFAIHTLGCKVNLFESNVIRNDLLSHGLVEVPFDDVADVYIVNTCTVTNKADSKSKFFIRKANKTNKNAIIVVAGCMSQINPELMKELKIDIQIGNKYKNNIFELLLSFCEKKERIVRIENLLREKEFEVTEKISFRENSRGFVKIQDGCNFMCSYCIIPFSRGRQRSNNMSKVLQEISDLVNDGFQEIVLTGVNTAGYLDENKNNFYDLLYSISQMKQKFRIRISSVEPFQISDEIINLVASNPERFCQHWHICLQSGSNDVLKKMNRMYTIQEFKDLINKIKKINPNTLFTTDYIVGFPTENKIDHQNSLTFLKEINFFDMHIFPYSKRKNTKASLLKEVDEITKKKRFKDVESIRILNKRKILKTFIGKEIEVIFDKKKDNEIYYSGYSSEYCKVYVKSSKKLDNKIHLVKINSLTIDGLIGELV